MTDPTVEATASTTIRTVIATRYVTPLREGGSLPAIVEADDDGLYVLKFRGAGQGPKALIAELVAGEIGRTLGLPVPEIVFVEVDPMLGRAEPDPEIQDLLERSVGLNLALDFLPGSVMMSPATSTPDAELASQIVWFDAYVTNVDRTPQNPNLLVWHKRLWLIDHGASLYFHHAWENPAQQSRSAFPMIRNHVLLPFATEIAAVDAHMRAKLIPELLAAIVETIPDDWLGDHLEFLTLDEHRAAYVSYLTDRLAAADNFVQEAVRARAAVA
ncbi:MAG: HipA family kinase [Thermomicrobiales bacterium]